jgi:hypothetical protein
MNTPRPQQKAWRFQADTVADMSFETYRHDLIHETPAIRDFLDDARGEVFVISAPRGFGKTLLLLAKSAEVLERNGTIFRGAGGQLLDKPSDQFPNWSADRIDALKDDPDFWRNLWRISIQAACVKHNAIAGGKPLALKEIKCHPLLDEALCNPDVYTSSCEFFVYLTNKSPSEQMKIMQNTGALSAYFNAIKRPINLFIDNVEEYFRPLLKDYKGESDADRQNAFGTEFYAIGSNRLWAMAQCTLVSAALELNDANSHVKVYCTIRHEAFLEMHRCDDRLQKIQGSTLQIIYTQPDYRKIFEKNIDLMAASDLVEPRAKDPMTRFVGARNTQMKHRVMRSPQETFAFILRHTVYRPRDLMLIGQAIADLRPEDRTDIELHRAVAGATGKIAAALVTEMRAFFPIPQLDVLARLIPRNALTATEIDDINQAYLATQKIERVEGMLEHSPMSVLYRIGLLGTIQRNFSELLPYQNFRKPFEIDFDEGDGLPTTEEFYLIHPCLDQFILERSGARYDRDFEARNMVGEGLSWAEPLKSFFVIKGDVCKFSKIMDSDTYPLLIGRLESWARTIAEHIYFYELSGGDSILLVDKNPFRLIDMAMQFLHTASQFVDESVSIRFGGSAGPVLFHTVMRRRASDTYEIDIPMGLPLRYAARVEPLARPDTLLIDDAFRTRMLEMTNGDHQASDYLISQVAPATVGMKADSAGRALVRKGPSDPAHVTNLWEVAINARP